MTFISPPAHCRHLLFSCGVIALHKFKDVMQATSVNDPYGLPWELIKGHYSNKLPPGFGADLKGAPTLAHRIVRGEAPILLTINLSQALNWLCEGGNAEIFGRRSCKSSLLLHHEVFSTEKLLIHYDGSQESARSVTGFVELFGENIRTSEAVIISPSFIPRSKIKEEEELIQLVRDATEETFFIKFNFSRIGDFWSYAIKNQCTLLITHKNHQSGLFKILSRFYPGKMGEYDRLSFYLSI